MVLYINKKIIEEKKPVLFIFGAISLIMVPFGFWIESLIIILVGILIALHILWLLIIPLFLKDVQEL